MCVLCLLGLVDYVLFTAGFDCQVAFCLGTSQLRLSVFARERPQCETQTLGYFNKERKLQMNFEMTEDHRKSTQNSELTPKLQKQFDPTDTGVIVVCGPLVPVHLQVPTKELPTTAAHRIYWTSQLEFPQ